MAKSQDIKLYERFPLRYAYDYLNQKGFSKDADEIKHSKDRIMSYDSTLRRGKIIVLLENNNLLDDFMSKYWNLGTPSDRQKELARCKDVYSRWLKTNQIPQGNNKRTESRVEDYQRSIEAQDKMGLNPELIKLLVGLLNDFRNLIADNKDLERYKDEYDKIQKLEYLFEDERFMEDWLERNIHKAVPNLEVIDRQPLIAWNEPFMRNRPDFFCIDKTTRELVIVENKVRGRDRRVETQYMTYNSWVKRNLEKINQKYSDKHIKATANFKFAIITDTTDERLQAICEDYNIALVMIGGGVYFETLVPY
jgi:hypothetical protein